MILENKQINNAYKPAHRVGLNKYVFGEICRKGGGGTIAKVTLLKVESTEL